MADIFRPQSYRLTGPGGSRSRLTVGSVPRTNISRRTGKIPAFILDLDQTIWDTTDEAKQIEDDLVFRLKKEKGFLVAKDWDEWTKAAAKVEPIPEMVDFVKGLEKSGLKPVIMTARDDANLEMIKRTLGNYGINADHIMTRGLDDVQQGLSSDALKVGMMERTRGRFNFLAMLDDSASNLRGAYRFGVPLGIQPAREGFDGLEASVVRGAKLSEVGGIRGMLKAERTIEPIVSAGASGVISPKTLKNIIESGQTAMQVMRGVL